MKKLDVEMKKTDTLLYQMIPKKIADQLRSGEKAANLCEVKEICHLSNAINLSFRRLTVVLFSSVMSSVLHRSVHH